jgi:hypothetical protein
VAPIGWYEQWLDEGEVPRGSRLFIGSTIGFDYALHTYDRERSAARDAISGVHLGATLESDSTVGPLRVRTTIDAHPSFAAVHAIAREAFGARHGSIDALPTVTRNEGYYFAAGATVAPRVVVETHGWEVGGETRWDRYWSIEGLDRDREVRSVDVSLEDWRTTSKAWVAFAPVDALAFSVAVLHRLRGGRVDAATAKHEESTILSSITAVF